MNTSNQQAPAFNMRLDSTGTNQGTQWVAHDLKVPCTIWICLQISCTRFCLTIINRLTAPWKIWIPSAHPASNTKSIDQSLFFFSNLQAVPQLKQADVSKITNHADETIQSLQKTAQGSPQVPCKGQWTDQWFRMEMAVPPNWSKDLHCIIIWKVRPKPR